VVRSGALPKRGRIPLFDPGYRESLAERKGLGIDSQVMKTAPLVVAVVTAAVLPAVLSSFGCNKKEDAPQPMSTATVAVVAPPPTTAVPAATPIAPVQPTATVAVGKAAAPAAHRGDAAAGAAPVARADAAPPPVVGLPPPPPGMQTVALPHPSALPGMAASVVSGMIQNLPPPIIPPPNPTQ
jgi:hypothetical protein